VTHAPGTTHRGDKNVKQQNQSTDVLSSRSLFPPPSSSNKVQATVVDYRTGACGARKTIYR
jgi:hypothetical protein